MKRPSLWPPFLAAFGLGREFELLGGHSSPSPGSPGVATARPSEEAGPETIIGAGAEKEIATKE
jgi:hypothetical protein